MQRKMSILLVLLMLLLLVMVVRTTESTTVDNVGVVNIEYMFKGESNSMATHYGLIKANLSIGAILAIIRTPTTSTSITIMNNNCDGTIRLHSLFNNVHLIKLNSTSICDQQQQQHMRSYPIEIRSTSFVKTTRLHFKCANRWTIGIDDAEQQQPTSTYTFAKTIDYAIGDDNEVIDDDHEQSIEYGNSQFVDKISAYVMDQVTGNRIRSQTHSLRYLLVEESNRDGPVVVVDQTTGLVFLAKRNTTTTTTTRTYARLIDIVDVHNVLQSVRICLRINFIGRMETNSTSSTNRQSPIYFSNPVNANQVFNVFVDHDGDDDDMTTSGLNVQVKRITTIHAITTTDTNQQATSIGYTFAYIGGHHNDVVNLQLTSPDGHLNLIVDRYYDDAKRIEIKIEITADDQFHQTKTNCTILVNYRNIRKYLNINELITGDSTSTNGTSTTAVFMYDFAMQVKQLVNCYLNGIRLTMFYMNMTSTSKSSSSSSNAKQQTQGSRLTLHDQVLPTVDFKLSCHFVNNFKLNTYFTLNGHIDETMDEAWTMDLSNSMFTIIMDHEQQQYIKLNPYHHFDLEHVNGFYSNHKYLFHFNVIGNQASSTVAHNSIVTIDKTPGPFADIIVTDFYMFNLAEIHAFHNLTMRFVKTKRRLLDECVDMDYDLRIFDVADNAPVLVRFECPWVDVKFTLMHSLHDNDRFGLGDNGDQLVSIGGHLDRSSYELTVNGCLQTSNPVDSYCRMARVFLRVNKTTYWTVWQPTKTVPTSEQSVLHLTTKIKRVLCVNLNQYVCESLFGVVHVDKTRIGINHDVYKRLNITSIRYKHASNHRLLVHLNMTDVRSQSNGGRNRVALLQTTFAIITNLNNNNSSSNNWQQSIDSTRSHRFHLNISNMAIDGDDLTNQITVREIRNLQKPTDATGTMSPVMDLSWSLNRLWLNVYDSGPFASNQIFEFALSPIDDSFFVVKLNESDTDLVVVRDFLSIRENSIASGSVLIDLSKYQHKYYNHKHVDSNVLYFVDTVTNDNGDNLRSLIGMDRDGYGRIYVANGIGGLDRELFGSNVYLIARQFLVNRQTIKIVKMITYKIDIEILDENDNEPHLAEYYSSLTVNRASCMTDVTTALNLDATVDILALNVSDADDQYDTHVFYIDYDSSSSSSSSSPVELPFDIDSRKGILKYLTTDTTSNDTSYNFDIIIVDGPNNKIKYNVNVDVVADHLRSPIDTTTNQTYYFDIFDAYLANNTIIGVIHVPPVFDRLHLDFNILNDDSLFVDKLTGSLVTRRPRYLTTGPSSVQLVNIQVKYMDTNVAYVQVFLDFMFTHQTSDTNDDDDDDHRYIDFNRDFQQALNTTNKCTIIEQPNENVCFVTTSTDPRRPLLKCLFSRFGHMYDDYNLKILEMAHDELSEMPVRIRRVHFERSVRSSANGSKFGGGLVDWTNRTRVAAVANVTIEVNDNTPIGTHVYSFDANATTRTRYLANTSAIYDTTYFDLNEYTGQLVVKRGFNYHVKNKLRMQINRIEVTHDGHILLMSVVQLDVQLLKVTIERPQFAYSRYEFVLSDDDDAHQTRHNDNAMSIGHVRAYSTHTSIPISYFLQTMTDDLVDSTAYFQINPYDGHLTIDAHVYDNLMATYDGNQVTSFRFNVIAQLVTNGPLPLTNAVPCQVNLGRRNRTQTLMLHARGAIASNRVMLDNNKPQFKRIYSTRLSENSPINTFVLQVQLAMSPNGTIGMPTVQFKFANGQMALSDISPNGGQFRIDPTDGRIYVNKVIDRETQTHFVLKVTAYSDPSSTSSWSIQTDISIYIDDVNDNAPVFVHFDDDDDSPIELDLSVADCNSTNHQLFDVKAQDADLDENGQVFYTMTTTSNDLFALNSSTGTLYVDPMVAQIQANMKHTLIVHAYDKGLPRLKSKPLVIHIRLSDKPQRRQIHVDRQSPTDTIDMRVYTIGKLYKYLVMDPVSSTCFDYDNQTGLLRAHGNHSACQSFNSTVPFRLLPNGAIWFTVTVDSPRRQQQPTVEVNLKTKTAKPGQVLHTCDAGMRIISITNKNQFKSLPFAIVNQTKLVLVVINDRQMSPIYNLTVHVHTGAWYDLNVFVFDVHLDLVQLYTTDASVYHLSSTVSNQSVHVGQIELTNGKWDSFDYKIKTGRQQLIQLELKRTSMDGRGLIDVYTIDNQITDDQQQQQSFEFEVELIIGLTHFDQYKSILTRIVLLRRVFKQNVYLVDGETSFGLNLNSMLVVANGTSLLMGPLRFVLASHGTTVEKIRDDGQINLTSRFPIELYAFKWGILIDKCSIRSRAASNGKTLFKQDNYRFDLNFNDDNDDYGRELKIVDLTALVYDEYAEKADFVLTNRDTLYDKQGLFTVVRRRNQLVCINNKWTMAPINRTIAHKIRACLPMRGQMICDTTTVHVQLKYNLMTGPRLLTAFYGIDANRRIQVKSSKYVSNMPVYKLRMIADSAYDAYSIEHNHSASPNRVCLNTTHGFIYLCNNLGHSDMDWTPFVLIYRGVYRFEMQIQIAKDSDDDDDVGGWMINRTIDVYLNGWQPRQDDALFLINLNGPGEIKRLSNMKCTIYDVDFADGRSGSGSQLDQQFRIDSINCNLYLLNNKYIGRALQVKVRLAYNNGPYKSKFFNLIVNRIAGRKLVSCALPNMPVSHSGLLDVDNSDRFISFGGNRTSTHLANINLKKNCMGVTTNDWFMPNVTNQFAKLNYLIYKSLHVHHNDHLRLYFGFSVLSLNEAKFLLFMQFSRSPIGEYYVYCELGIDGLVICKHNLNNAIDEQTIQIDTIKITAGNWYLFELLIDTSHRQLTINLAKWMSTDDQSTQQTTRVAQVDVDILVVDLYVAGVNSIALINEYMVVRKVFNTFCSHDLLITKAIYFNQYNLYELKGHEMADQALLSHSVDDKYKRCPSPTSATTTVWSYNCDIVRLALRLNADYTRHVISILMTKQYEDYLHINRLIGDYGKKEFSLVLKLEIARKATFNEQRHLPNDERVTTNVTLLKTKNSNLYLTVSTSHLVTINYEQNNRTLLSVKVNDRKPQRPADIKTMNIELKQSNSTLSLLVDSVSDQTSIGQMALEIFQSSQIEIHLTKLDAFIGIALVQVNINKRQIPLYNSLTDEYRTSLVDRNILITNYYDPSKPLTSIDTQVNYFSDMTTDSNSHHHPQLATYAIVIIIACGLLVLMTIVSLVLVFVYRKHRFPLIRTNSTANNSNNSLLKQNSTKSHSLSSSTLCSTVMSHDVNNSNQLTITRPLNNSTLKSINDNDLNLFIINDLNEFLFIQQSPFDKFKTVFDDLSSLDGESTSYVYYDDTASTSNKSQPNKQGPSLQTYV